MGTVSAVVATHILPKLGGRPLQQLRVGEIDALYRELDGRPTLVRYVHTVLRLMLGAAVRKGLLQKNPAANATIPRASETTVGRALEPAELRRLLDGLRNSAVFPLVLCAAATGIRLGEALTLQWSDLNIQAKTLSISRTIEETRAHGRRTKPPKSARGRRVIAIDDALITVLLAEREKHLRIVAGVPDAAGDINLSLVRLPPAALIFPTLAGGEFEPTRLRSLKGTSRQLRNCFKRLGFKMRVHDLRTTHATMLLNAGVPVHTAAARLGHSPVMLLKVYAKQTKQADADAADAVAKLIKGAGS